MEKDLKALRIDRNRRRSRPSPNLWLIGLAAFLAGAVLTALLFHNLSRQTSNAARAEVRVDPATVAPAGAAVDGASDREGPLLIVSGYIVPHHRIEVSSRIMGKVAWVGVDKSDRVEKGQLLVRLEDAEFQAQLQQAEADSHSARARLTELETGSRPEEIEIAKAELERSRVGFDNADLEYRRFSQLVESGVIAQQRVDNARSRRDMAKAAVAVAEKNHRLLEIGPRTERIQAARAELERSQAAIRYWQTQLQETEIRAPVSGTILERVVEVGEMVSAYFMGGAVLVALADLRDLQAELDISQSDFHNISPENGCRMSPIAYPAREYECELEEIAPEANRQRATIQVKVQILEPDEYLRPEMDVQVTFFRKRTDSGAEDTTAEDTG